MNEKPGERRRPRIAQRTSCRIDSNIGLGTAGWYNGDFNYDGKVNVDDYTIIDSNIGIQGAPFPTALAATPGVGGLPGVTAVPEPATLWTIALAASGLASRRRRQKRAR